MDTTFPEIKYIIEEIYGKAGVEVKNYTVLPEGKAYEACTFELNGHKIIHRTSNITPTKIGQFVAIWKRNEKGITAPYDMSDDFDFMIISCRNEDKLGQFIFSKEVLLKQNILSNNKLGGKRGIRVYPDWDVPDNNQAKKTQTWQTDYFVNINCDKESIQRKLLEKLRIN